MPTDQPRQATVRTYTVCAGLHLGSPRDPIITKCANRWTKPARPGRHPAYCSDECRRRTGHLLRTLEAKARTAGITYVPLSQRPNDWRAENAPTGPLPPPQTPAAVAGRTLTPAPNVTVTDRPRRTAQRRTMTDALASTTAGPVTSAAADALIGP